MVRKIMNKLVQILLVITTIASFTINTFASEFAVNDDTKQEESICNDSVMNDNVDSIISEEYDNEEILLNQELYRIINDPLTGIDELKESILKTITYSEGVTKKQEINNLATYSAALRIKYPEMSELELGKTILLSLGDSEEFIENLPNEKIIEATGYLSVEKTESFYKQTSNGVKIELSEDEYYLEIANVSVCQLTNEAEGTINNMSPQTTILSSPDYDQTETMDSYIKLTSTAYKTNPIYAQSGRNYFTIRGEVEWTKTPLISGKDVLAIASSGNVDHNYSSYAFANWIDIDGESFSGDVSSYAYIGQNSGIGTEPIFGGGMRIYNPSIYGVALDVNLCFDHYPLQLEYAYIYYGISMQDDVTCQVGYAHQTLGLSGPSVSIDLTGGISFSVGLGLAMNDYYGQAFTLHHESYSVLLSSPANNASLEYNGAPPTFFWNAQSGNPEQFVLEIDYLNNGVYKTININSGNTHQLSSSDWNTIKDYAPFFGSGTKRIKWRIKVNYSIYPDETPYCTEWYTFTITGVPVTTQETLPTIEANHRYTEKVVYLDQGKYKDFFVKFAVGGNRLIQTFGTNDTVLELYSSNGTILLGENDTDDEGYSNNALISYNFTANTTYRIRVKYYSSSTYGNTKLTIVTTYPHENYESAYGPYGSTTVGWDISRYRVALFRYEFDSNGIATFKMSAELDTYIYIIDPTSTDLIVRYAQNNTSMDNLYDDDSGGNGQAQLSKYVQAGKEYLVIISFYNPNTMTGDFTITSSLEIV